MEQYNRLYEVSENANVQFVGFAINHTRYDFALVFTREFFGKVLVVCLQANRSALVCTEDTKSIEYIMKAFRIPNYNEAEELAIFLNDQIPATSWNPERELS